MALYQFDGTMSGLLCCVFHAFQFKEFDVQVNAEPNHQTSLFDESIVVHSNDEQAKLVFENDLINAVSYRTKRFRKLADYSKKIHKLFKKWL